jgi:MFS family permease
MFANQADGSRYLGRERGMIVLLTFVFFASFLNGFVYVLFRPMILSLADTAVLGTLVTIAGVGGLAGALFVSFFMKTQDRVVPLLFASLISALSMILCGATESLWLIGTAAFTFSFAIPIVVVTAQTLWQSLVPVELQGRVFSTRTLFVSIATLLAVLVSPLLAEHFAEPAMNANAALGQIFGAWIGTGPGRGMAFLFIVAGLTMLAITAVASRNPHLLRLRFDHAEPAARQS